MVRTKEEIKEAMNLATCEALLYGASDEEGPWWWLSFCDPDLPEGTQFLGGCLIDAPNEAAAVARTHLLGINPGGEVAIWGPIQEAPAGHPRRVLMSRQEIEEADAETP